MNFHRAFTLTELIVVITILAILSTIGFISYSSYLTSVRDSNRISQLTKLSDSLQIYSVGKSLPLPDNKIDIKANSTIIAYQGYVGANILEIIDYTNGGKDPKDNNYYTYYLTKDRKSVQLLALMEEPQTISFKGIAPSIADTYAATYENRYPKVYGRKLGVLTQSTTNTPAQEITVNTTNGNLDIVNTTEQYVSHISDSYVLEGTGSTLMASIPNANCNRIKQTGGAKGNGVYEINPGGNGNIKMYCDMETAGGGWTLIRYSLSGANSWTNTYIDINSNTSTSAYSYPYSHIHDFSIFGYTQTMLKLQDSDKYKIDSEVDGADFWKVQGYSLINTGISGGVSGDGFNGEQGMLFLR